MNTGINTVAVAKVVSNGEQTGYKYGGRLVHKHGPVRLCKCLNDTMSSITIT